LILRVERGGRPRERNRKEIIEGSQQKGGVGRVGSAVSSEKLEGCEKNAKLERGKRK